MVTIGLTGKQYLLQQIQNVGSNMMVAEVQEGGGSGIQASSDLLNLDDWDAAKILASTASLPSPWTRAPACVAIGPLA